MVSNEPGPKAGPVAGWSNGEQYEGYVGRWSRLVAGEFLQWLARPDAGRWLDAGCGTGVLCETILSRMSPSEVIGIDVSDGMLAFARERLLMS